MLDEGRQARRQRRGHDVECLRRTGLPGGDRVRDLLGRSDELEVPAPPPSREMISRTVSRSHTESSLIRSEQLGEPSSFVLAGMNSGNGWSSSKTDGSVSNTAAS